jgi:hypothetical protein
LETGRFGGRGEEGRDGREGERGEDAGAGEPGSASQHNRLLLSNVSGPECHLVGSSGITKSWDTTPDPGRTLRNTRRESTDQDEKKALKDDWSMLQVLLLSQACSSITVSSKKTLLEVLRIPETRSFQTGDPLV